MVGGGCPVGVVVGEHAENNTETDLCLLQNLLKCYLFSSFIHDHLGDYLSNYVRTCIHLESGVCMKQVCKYRLLMYSSLPCVSMKGGVVTGKHGNRIYVQIHVP